MKNKRFWAQLLMTLGLLVIGAVLSLYLFQDSLSAWVVRSNHVAVTTASVKRAKTPKKQPTYAFDQVKPLSLASLSAAAVAKHSVAAVGKIVIPDINLNLPIALGVGNAELAFAAGTLNDNQKMGEGNYPLAGHHMAQDERLLFGPLVKSHVGMIAYISDMVHIYAYQIYSRSYIPATQVSVLNETPDAELTLVTCDDDGTGRLLVQARMIGKMTFDKAPKQLQQLLNDME